jgi:hypothetical protein
VDHNDEMFREEGRTVDRQSVSSIPSMHAVASCLVGARRGDVVADFGDRSGRPPAQRHGQSAHPEFAARYEFHLVRRPISARKRLRCWLCEDSTGWRLPDPPRFIALVCSARRCVYVGLQLFRSTRWPRGAVLQCRRDGQCSVRRCCARVHEQRIGFELGSGEWPCVLVHHWIERACSWNRQSATCWSEREPKLPGVLGATVDCRSLIVAGLVIVAGCGSAPGPAGGASSSADAPQVPVESVPSTNSEPLGPTVTAVISEPTTTDSAIPDTTTLNCDGSSTGTPTDSPRLSSVSDWVVGTMATADGQVGLVAVSKQGGTDVLGCMTSSTADNALKLGVSMASVEMLADGVRVVVAVPAGRRMRSMDWLRPIGEAGTISGTDPRFVTLLFVTERPPDVAIDKVSPTEAQLAQLVRDAFAGTSSVAGLAPDILEPA